MGQISDAKIKVVFLCHLSSQAIRDKMFLRSNKIENRVRKLLHKKLVQYEDNAPWNINILEELSKNDEIEIHVVSPHPGLVKETQSFSLNGIYYHFFQCDVKFPINYFRRRNEKKGVKPYKENRRLAKKLIEEIKPDMINLIGSENPDYASVVLDIESLPILLTCQTVYSNPTRREYDKNFSQLRWDIEQAIFQKVDCFSCMGELHRDLVLKYRPDAIIFKLVFPYKAFPDIKEVEKKFDFVYFAQTVSVKKGVNNAVEALAMVKEKRPKVSMLIVGANHEPYKTVLNNRIAELGLTDNITFHDYFPKQEDMFQYVKQARFAVLPVKIDIVSGTILQAMRMGLPVVTHITSGTPKLNKKNECVLLSEIDDDRATADNMLKLMESPELAERLIKNSLAYLEAEDEEAKQAGSKWLAQYHALYNHYYKGVDFPDLLIYK